MSFKEDSEKMDNETLLEKFYDAVLEFNKNRLQPNKEAMNILWDKIISIMNKGE